MRAQELLAVLDRGYPGSPEITKHGQAILNADGEDRPWPKPEDHLAACIAGESLILIAEDMSKVEVLQKVKRTLQRLSLDLQLVINEVDRELDDELLALLARLK